MDIDLVYLWVDGNDPVWLTKKNEFLPADRQVDPQVAGECRYVENDELRYSLRSVEKFAPWIRRVYIVTDDQTPAWLDTSNLRIRVVSHREIMPAEILPVFNSCTIELFLPRIPGLAEHFLYANDDMFFSRPVDPGFFFDWQGRPIVRLKVQSLKKHDDDIYCHTILRMQDLVRARYGRCSSLAPHHNVDAYRRSDFLECCETFRAELEHTKHARFRSRDDWQRALVLYDALARGRASLRKVLPERRRAHDRRRPYPGPDVSRHPFPRKVIVRKVARGEFAATGSAADDDGRPSAGLVGYFRGKMPVEPLLAAGPVAADAVFVTLLVAVAARTFRLVVMEVESDAPEFHATLMYLAVVESYA